MVLLPGSLPPPSHPLSWASSFSSRRQPRSHRHLGCLMVDSWSGRLREDRGGSQRRRQLSIPATSERDVERDISRWQEKNMGLMGAPPRLAHLCYTGAPYIRRGRHIAFSHEFSQLLKGYRPFGGLCFSIGGIGGLPVVPLPKYTADRLSPFRNRSQGLPRVHRRLPHKRVAAQETHVPQQQPLHHQRTDGPLLFAFVIDVAPLR
mmetsp:Transcript_241/g.1015  ORF Transcript_241/g.1015 Transcript_241/m.1015 type:complete len:205 (-) Transcript_241:78-692(-)